MAKALWEGYTLLAKAQFNMMVSSIMIGIEKMKIGWYKFKNMLGLGDSAKNNEALLQAQNNVENLKTSIKKGYDESGKKFIEAYNQGKLAAGSLKWNDKSLGDLIGGVKKKIGMPTGEGIAPPNVPGKDNTDIPDDDKDKKDKSKTNEAIATGGQRHNYITINLKDLIGVLNITGKDFKDSTNQMTQQTEDALVRVLAMATTAGV